VTVYTVGHSTLAVGDLVDLLARNGVAGVADVRRHPGSRRHPQFAREALAAALERAGITYRWLPALGGRRPARADSPHVAWRNRAFRGYADHMDQPEFRQALEDLVRIAAERPTAVLCAEAVPWRCHRQLVADALVAAGHEVRHLLGSQPPAAHRLTPFARRVGDRLLYDGGQPALPLPPGGSPRTDRP
jgi:uncharacterized protein (DUF488 family)